MKILWLCNIILPDISRCINETVSNYGGWLDGLSKDIRKKDNVSLTVVFPYKKEINGTCEKIKYYSFLNTNQKNLIEERFKKIILDVKPDVIHIWGTEYFHTLYMVNTAEKLDLVNKVIISIQGMCSIYAKHYYADLPYKVIKRFTFRDLIKKDNLILQKNKFKERGKAEIKALEKVSHVIGRTDWDYACTKQINSKILYHFCNETLRDSFYIGDKWDYNKCERHSIFISQAGYPIKGFHFLLEALPIVLNEFPDAKVYVAGNNIIKRDTLKNRLRLSSYSKYIISLIKEKRLESNVKFLGGLTETEMKERYLLSNVFVSPSSIENSPNSIGEAMILGVPVVSSDVGGVKNLLQHEKEGYIYQSNAPYMLAFYIMKVFEDSSRVASMSINAIKKAEKTHSRQQNIDTMLAIYQTIK